MMAIELRHHYTPANHLRRPFSAAAPPRRASLTVSSVLGGRAQELIQSGAVSPIAPKDASSAIESHGYALLDVRPQWEREKAHVSGSLHVPLFVEDKDNSPLTLLKKWVHFGYIGLWTGQYFTMMNPNFVGQVEEIVPDKDSKILVACGEGLRSVFKRIKSALLWVIVTAVVCALVLGILYGLVGKVDFTVRHLSSDAEPFPSSWGFSSGQQCIGGGARQCAAYSASASSETTWTMRATFPEYVVALATIVGSVLFTIFGGVGIACLPLGLIFSFIRRPKAVITRSQYIKEATELGKKARELKKAADALHQEERSGDKGRKWRKNVKAVEKELLLLEEDVKALEEMYPQGEKAEASWALTVLGYLAKLVLGVLGLIVSVAWVAHIVIYLLIDPPLSPFLNEVFIKLDDVWGLLGTAAFAFFCFYLLIAVVAGAMMLGMKLVFITIHPMKWGGTLMNSFLFNVGLILLSSISVIQFCATAFGYYAQATAAQEIFGHTLQSLRGIKYLYKYNVFQIAFIVLAGLTFIYYAAFGWRRKKPSGRFQLST